MYLVLTSLYIDDNNKRAIPLESEIVSLAARSSQSNDEL